MSDLFKFAGSITAQLEHERNLKGLTRVKCPNCSNGKRSEAVFTHDGYGSTWIPGEDCAICGGSGRIQIACSASTQLQAVEKQISIYKEEVKILKKRIKSEQAST